MMKRILLFCLTILSFNLFAQIPANDDCTGIINLGEAPLCDSSAIYNNINATTSQIFDPPSNVNIPSCWDNVNNDVWFEFTVPADGSVVDFTVLLSGEDLNGTPMTQPQVAVYRGDCAVNELDELLCAKADVGESSLELDLLGLTPGIPYFLRVDDFSATATPNWGDFILCVDTLAEVNTIDEGSSTSCSGELYDSGGPDEDYSNGENFVFEICPPVPNNECITFNIEYYNIDDAGDQMNIYSGTNGVGGTQIASIGGFGANGMTGDGGVCFTTQATGCLTVEFISDGTSTFEGFAANWECSAQPCETLDVVEIETTTTEQDIIDAVASPQTVISNVLINCPDGAYGTFVADNSDLGLEKGLVLSSGQVSEMANPANFFASSINGSPGDSDLDYFSNQSGGAASQDACVVEMDVFAATDELTFEYVFGSEEYPNFVNSTFNDIFAFLISGPGINGDVNIANQLNIATLPDGNNTLVEINSVNFENNWEYYRNNELGQSVVYGGLTSDYLGVKKSLTANATVDPCNTYHLKLAIADRGDSSFDSGVFVSEIKGGTPQLSVNFASGIDYLIEGCSGTADELVVSLNNPQEDIAQYGVSIGGTATLGVDYILNMPDTVTLNPGQTILNYPLIPLVDNLLEGTETIIITLSNNFGCGTINFAEITIELTDEPEVIINLGADTALVCAGNGLSLNVEGATTYFWTPVSVVDNATSPNPFATPTSDVMVFVEGNVGPCFDTDSIFLQIVDPQISINPLTVTNICEGTDVMLEAVNNVNNQNLIWTPGITLPDPNAQTITDTPPVTTTYTASVEVAGCLVEDQITVNVDPFDFPNLTTTDTTLCESYFFDLAAPIPGTTTTYEWTPNINMNNNTLPNPTVQANAGNLFYTVVATSANSYCTQLATVNVTGIPANANINNDDYIEICLGETVDLSANTSTAGVGFEWQSNPIDPTLAPISDTLITVMPLISTTYFTQLVVGACTVLDSITVRVDSLPDLSVETIPFKDIYCAGDIVSIVTPTYEPSSFPDIMHQWGSHPSIDSDLENLNLVLVMTETNTYTRTTTNRACTDVKILTLDVVDPILDLAWDTITVCAGDQISNEEFNGIDDFMWSTNAGSINGSSEMSTVNLTTSNSGVLNVSATIQDCPANAEAIINVESVPVVSITGINSIQVGTDVEFTAVISNGGTPDDQYIWTYNGQPAGTGNPIIISILEISDGNPDANSISVTVINEFGCEGLATFTVDGTIPNYLVPNVFTPDGDGLNDFFNFTYEGYNGQTGTLGPVEVIRFSIWNRWGNLVYNNETPDTGWDGTFNGEAAPADVYIYTIQLKYPDGEIKTIKSPDAKSDVSDVTLIR